MKRLLSLLCCLVPTLAHAQAPATALRPDSATQRLTRAEVVVVPGASQADLYARAQTWLAAAYQTTATAAKGMGVVQGTGWREIEMRVSSEESTPLKLWYTVTVAVQPGRYRYAVTEFQTQLEPTPANANPEKQAIELVLSKEKAAAAPRTDYGQQAADAAQAVAETIKAGMANPDPESAAHSAVR